jgi:hypothetical protein
MEKEKRRCETCAYYEVNADGLKVCGDYEGLYFQCEMTPDERCPEYVNSEKVKIKSA